jgi:hypothetical protein
MELIAVRMRVQETEIFLAIMFGVTGNADRSAHGSSEYV